MFALGIRPRLVADERTEPSNEVSGLMLRADDSENNETSRSSNDGSQPKRDPTALRARKQQPYTLRKPNFHPQPRLVRESDASSDSYAPAAVPPEADSEAEPEDTPPVALTNSQDFLRAPPEPEAEAEPPGEAVIAADLASFGEYFRFPSLGYAGRSGVGPSEGQQDDHFVPMEDRWRVGFPQWDRYDWGHPRVLDYPYMEGRKLDSYNQNVLKGDYPIIGQNTFLALSATSLAVLNFRQVPTAQFEDMPVPGQPETFGNPNQFFYTHYFSLSFDLFHGNAAFKQPDWRLKITPVMDLNYLAVNERGVISPNPADGTERLDDFFAMQEWFAEAKLADLSPDYDTLSVRGGSQFFNSDFRGLMFFDTNRAIRLFGTRLANRAQFNVIWLDQAEKDINSFLNSYSDRGQDILILNYFRQDFIWPGYTAQASFHYNHDRASRYVNSNGFQVRPDPVGADQPHSINGYYLGWTGQGHINRFNISHALYYAFGRDSLNPLAEQPLNISAQMAALELSYDRDWIRFRTSLFHASGDPDIHDGKGQGFDTILDNPNFAGGQFSYWQRQPIRLYGVNLVQRQSLVPDLRSNKLQGQTNFVNPGLDLVNLGMEIEVAQPARVVANLNFLWFDNTNVLEAFVEQDNIRRSIGVDLSLGLEYRPWLNNRGILVAGVSGLIPGQGFYDLYNPLQGAPRRLFASFVEFSLSY